MKNKFIIIVMLVAKGINVSSQTINDRIYSDIAKSILIYKILMSKEHIESTELYRGKLKKSPSVMYTYLPNNNCRLKLIFRQSDIKFIDSSYIVFEVSKGLTEYDCDTDKIVIGRSLFNNDRKFLIAVNKMKKYYI